MKKFIKLFFLLTPAEQKHAALLLLMITIMALLDMIGVASILPFMAVLTNPNLIDTNSVLNFLYKTSSIFGAKSVEDFLFFLGVAVFILLIVSLTFKALVLYLQSLFVLMCEYSIGKRLIEGYLNQPYVWFLNQNSAEIGKTILSEVQEVATKGLSSAFKFISYGLISLSLIFLLIIIDPKLIFYAGLTFGSAYVLIFYFVRKFLVLIGKKRLQNNQLRFRAVSEAFGASKDVKLGGLENIYVSKFSKYARVLAKTQASAILVSNTPRYAIEALGFGGILLIMLHLMQQTNGISNFLPIISLYVFAGYRLLPSFQHIYSSFTQLTFVGPSLDKLYDDLKHLKQPEYTRNQQPLPFNDKIVLKNVHFSYPNVSRTTLLDANLKIPAKKIVGIIGPTGSGKTTIVDIILGLLEAQKGTLEVDGKVISNQNLRSWQKIIGYVPQHIYLSDNTVSENIAFGIDPKDIDEEKLKRAAQIANLHNFIIDELPRKYLTTVGERGVRLSGGQRQRIGIARALYHNPKVLILDEATSALDNQTEQAVMDAVNNLGKKITIIMIAHRLNTIKKCDIIYKLEKGKIVNSGTYEEIIKIN